MTQRVESGEKTRGIPLKNANFGLDKHAEILYDKRWYQ